MFEALSLLKHLEDYDVQWILDNAEERNVISGTVIIQEGDYPEAIFTVLQGLVGVHVGNTGAAPVATLGPGELLGEISQLEQSPATASVIAIENSLVLALDVERLEGRLVADASFARRWYRAVALTLSRRLRERVLSLTERLRSKEASAGTTAAAWEPLLSAISQFKLLLRDTDQLILKQGQIQPDQQREFQQQFSRFTAFLNETLGDGSTLDEQARTELGARLEVEMLPYVLLTKTAERFYSKPRGYAGDYLTIEMIYQNKADGSQRLGPLLDRCFLDQPSAAAVRNRRGLLADEVAATCDQVRKGPVHITSLACGPAEELFDVLETSPNSARIRPTLVDIDADAIQFVRNKALDRGVSEQFRIEQGNLVYLAMGRQKLDDLPPQDLVYSIGLIDYFNDKWVLKLIDYIHTLLRPGGRVILGNFHTANVDKAFMDHVLNWKLIHRSEEDMNRLFAASKFGKPCTNIRLEEAGVNMFADCTK